jgi:hypothetical protein
MNKKSQDMNKKSQKQTVSSQVVTLITPEGKKIAFKGKHGIYVQMPKQEKTS